MKIIYLSLLSVAILGVANAKAQEITVWQQIGRGLEDIGDAAMRKEMREEAKEWAEYQAALAQAKAEHEKWAQKMYRDQALRNQARDAAFTEDAKANSFYYTDPLPLWNTYDNAATIKFYLRDSGYNDLSDAQISKISAYMKANGIHHISELSELTKALEATPKS